KSGATVAPSGIVAEKIQGSKERPGLLDIVDDNESTGSKTTRGALNIVQREFITVVAVDQGEIEPKVETLGLHEEIHGAHRIEDRVILQNLGPSREPGQKGFGVKTAHGMHACINAERQRRRDRLSGAAAEGPDLKT